MRTTKKNYENYLNDSSPEQGSEEWIIGGKIRFYYMWKNQWGTALRKYDPIGFEVGYKEFKREQKK